MLVSVFAEYVLVVLKKVAFLYKYIFNVCIYIRHMYLF